MSARDDDVLIGEADGIHIREHGGDVDDFDYVLAGPSRGEFAFHAPEIPDLMEMLEHMLGDG